MSNKKQFDNIVSEQFPTSRWASLGLEAEFPGISPGGRLGKYVTGLFLGYYATRDNETKYRKLIAKGLPADYSLLMARERATQRINIFKDIYGDVVFDLNDPEVGDDVTFESLVNNASFDRYYRTKCLASVNEQEKDKLYAIAARIQTLWINEREQQFSEILEVS